MLLVSGGIWEMGSDGDGVGGWVLQHQTVVAGVGCRGDVFFVASGVSFCGTEASGGLNCGA